MAGEDRDFVAWLHTRHCVLIDTAEFTCSGYVEAHHTGRRGLSQRAHDHTAIPLCRKHHAEFHSASGHFKGWDRDKRRAWQDRISAVIQQAWSWYQEMQGRVM